MHICVTLVQDRSSYILLLITLYLNLGSIYEMDCAASTHL